MTLQDYNKMHFDIPGYETILHHVFLKTMSANMKVKLSFRESLTFNHSDKAAPIKVFLIPQVESCSVTISKTLFYIKFLAT